MSRAAQRQVRCATFSSTGMGSTEQQAQPGPSRACSSPGRSTHPLHAMLQPPKHWEVLEEIASASDSGLVETSRGISRRLRFSGCTRGLMPVMDATISCASRNDHPHYLLTCFITQRNCPISGRSRCPPCWSPPRLRGPGADGGGGARGSPEAAAVATPLPAVSLKPSSSSSSSSSPSLPCCCRS